MAVILNIDTATEVAGVCLGNEENILGFRQGMQLKDHASFLQNAIREMLAEINCNIADIDAVAVTAGPGSYTGLRVGLSSAKGLCYALGKPLIMMNTLEVMAYSAITEVIKEGADAGSYLFCPMIDARRMEVFAAVYNSDLEMIRGGEAIVLDEYSFTESLENNVIIFSGNGSDKFRKIVSARHALFSDVIYNAKHLAFLSQKAFTAERFSNLAYSEPNYLKDFFTFKKN